MSILHPAPAMRVHDRPSDFRLLEEEWNELFRRHGGWNVFLSWLWHREWWAAFGAANDLRLLTLRHQDRLVGVVPAMVEPDGAGGRQLALIGSDETTDYGDILAEPAFRDAVAESLAEFTLSGLGDEWDRVVLRNLPQSSPLLGTFRQSLKARGLEAGVVSDMSCPIAALAPTWDEYLGTLSKKDRHELRRKMRRARAAGHQELLFFSSPTEVGAAMETFFRLHRASAPEKAAFLSEQMESFFGRMAVAFAKEGWLRLNLMRIDGRDVAASLSFSLGERVLLYNSGLDPEYRVHSVGIALHAAEIERAIEEGKQWYDFLRGNEPYKYGFGAKDSPIFTLSFPPAGAATGDRCHERG